MFRCVTELKGFIIDIDSFCDCDLASWRAIQNNYECLFLTENEATGGQLVALFHAKVYIIEPYELNLAPNAKTHYDALDQLGLHTFEVAYLSTNFEFLQRALCFLSGTVWITENVNYSKASVAPDIICDSVEKLEDCLDRQIMGFYGEMYVYPNQVKAGIIKPVDFEADDGMKIPLFMLGRYFGYSHYMNQLHPYSAAIYLNKKSNGKAYQKFNNTFAHLYCVAIKKIQSILRIDGICAVPARPGNHNRFQDIVAKISDACHIENWFENLVCVRDYPSQKDLSSYQREVNVKDVFQYHGDLSKKRVVLIDDIISTGATIRACVRQLQKAGAEQIIIVVLAVNQLGGSYWSSVVPQINCPQCEGKMRLLVNSNSLGFFYSCQECGKTLDFKKAIKRLLETIDLKPGR